MATPKDQEGFDNEDLISSDTGDSSELYNNDDPDDGILNVNPGSTAYGPRGGKQTPGFGHNVKTPGLQQNDNNQPGATKGGETSMGQEPNEEEQYQQEEKSPATSYVDSIHIAISSLHKEILKSEQERKQSEIVIERQFAQIIETLCNKKFELVQKMNEFYDDQKQDSLDRIQELKSELSEKELEIAIEKEKERERQEELKREEEEKKQHEAELAAKRAQQAEEPMTNYRRLSLLGNKLKENAVKAKNAANRYYEEWKNANKEEAVAAQATYSKHDKIRLFVPKKELTKLIETDIRLSTEWWDPFRLNHIVYNTYDAELWRTSAINGGWYNAFGSIKVRKSQTKRWNIKICDRVKQQRTGKKQPAEVVLGVIESSKAKSQDKAAGFWSKGWDGFGIYGLYILFLLFFHLIIFYIVF